MSGRRDLRICRHIWAFLPHGQGEQEALKKNEYDSELIAFGVKALLKCLTKLSIEFLVC